MIPPNITQPQFIELGTTGVLMGKKAKTNIGNKNAMAAMLMAKPYRPRDQRRTGSGSFRNRFEMRQPIVRMYDDINEDIVIELIALSATVEPMLISVTSTTIASETMMALIGMLWFRFTYYSDRVSTDIFSG